MPGAALLLTDIVSAGIAGRCAASGQEPVQDEVERVFCAQVRRCAESVCQEGAREGGFPWPRFAERLWRCLEYHWQPRSSSGAASIEDIVKSLTAWGADSSDILHDVTVALALELRYPAAAEMFQQQWMPLVRATARRVGGPSAEELVENFSADLILPRGQSPPRIARYQGRTPLAAWLRVVVANHCLSELRRRPAWSPVEDLAEAGQGADPDHRSCRELLEPIVRRAVAALDQGDRLMLKLLVLDDIPQQQVARLLGIHSGNVTRRRQRAAESAWRAVAAEAERAGKRQAAGDCLELVLTGQDPALRGELSRQMTQHLQALPEASS